LVASSVTGATMARLGLVGEPTTKPPTPCATSATEGRHERAPEQAEPPAAARLGLVAVQPEVAATSGPTGTAASTVASTRRSGAAGERDDQQHRERAEAATRRHHDGEGDAVARFREACSAA
jgi:hypothetical protein